MKTVEVTNLEKKYRDNKVVDDLSFSVNSGEVLGLLGPNGAGKSTTLNMLSTILKPDKGSITILGKNLKTNIDFSKKSIGMVPQDLAIYEEISTEENVKFFASLYGLKGTELKKNVEESLTIVGLLDKKRDKPKTFSGGMKRRLNIACAITHHPKLLIMDEPTVGIDPQSRNHILETIQKLKADGISIIYSTHYMEEVELIADKILIMNEGKVIAEGTKEELYERINSNVNIKFVLRYEEKLNLKELTNFDGITYYALHDNVLEIHQVEEEFSLNHLISYILSNGCHIDSMTTERPTLENLFLDLTGRMLKD